MRCLLMLLFLANGLAKADWTGSGTYSDPYVFTAPVENEKYYGITRGQTLFNDEYELTPGVNKSIDYQYQQFERKEDFKKLLEDQPLMRSRDEGSLHDQKYSSLYKKDAAGT